jgi:hypothetical protein
MVYHALAQPVDADAALARLIASAATSEPSQIADVYAYRGDFDDALAWLQRIGRDEGCRNKIVFRAFYSPFLALMRGDSRWEAWRTDTARTTQECYYVR